MWGGPQVWAPIETVEGLPVEGPGGYPQKSATHVKRDVSKETSTIPKETCERDLYTRHYSRGFE